MNKNFIKSISGKLVTIQVKISVNEILRSFIPAIDQDG